MAPKKIETCIREYRQILLPREGTITVRNIQSYALVAWFDVGFSGRFISVGYDFRALTLIYLP